MNKIQNNYGFYVRYYFRLSRARGWWDNFLHLAGAAYLLWDYSGQNGIDLYGSATYMGAVLCLLAGGYALNDATDFPQDSVLYSDCRSQSQRIHSIIYALTTLLTGMILLLVATRKTLALGIGVVTLLTGMAYFVPPIRLKKRGGWGVIVGAAAQKPALFLIFAAMIETWNWLTAILTVWLFCGSMLSMLGHQILDYRNDLAIGVNTFTARHGIKLSLWLCIVSAVGICMMILVPASFAPVSEAMPIVGLLAVMSLVYAGKSILAMRNIIKT